MAAKCFLMLIIVGVEAADFFAFVVIDGGFAGALAFFVFTFELFVAVFVIENALSVAASVLVLNFGFHIAIAVVLNVIAVDFVHIEIHIGEFGLLPTVVEEIGLAVEVALHIIG